MPDIVSPEVRSRMMSGIRGKDTKPELLIRSQLHSLGFRYHLHDSRIPGKPDMVFPKYSAVILVHGCFWHGHKGCRRATRPATNESFWNQKLDGNIRRDERFKAELRRLGWKVLVVWECETHKPEKLIPKLSSFLNGQTNKDEQAS